MRQRIRKHDISDIALSFGPLGVTGGEAGGGIAADKPDAPTPKDVGDKADGKGKPADEWRGKFEGQQKVNRDLEAKLNGIRDALKAAAGVEDKKADDEQVLASVRDELAALRHENTVEKVARRHGITEDTHVKLLGRMPDEATMDELATHLAKGKGDGDDKSKPGKPGTPKPDSSQGKGGGDGAVRPTSVAQVMEDRRAAREKTKTTS